MIYVFMALYAEAKPLIEKLELKKINSRFTELRNREEVVLSSQLVRSVDAAQSVIAPELVPGSEAVLDVRGLHLDPRLVAHPL